MKSWFKKKTDIAPQGTTPQVTDFEKNLFRNGVYVFDFDGEIREAERGILSHQEWLNRSWEKSRHKESMDYTISHERHEVMWKQAFSGKIPKHWEIWHGPMHDFEEAGKHDIQLSQTLIDAGVSHSHHLVVNEAGKSQKLSPEQLAVVIARKEIKNIPEWNYDQIITAQRKKGLTQEDYWEAERISKDLIRDMRRRPKEEAGTFIAPSRKENAPKVKGIQRPRIGGGN